MTLVSCHHCGLPIRLREKELTENDVWLIQNYSMKFTGRHWHTRCLFKEFNYADPNNPEDSVYF